MRYLTFFLCSSTLIAHPSVNWPHSSGPMGRWHIGWRVLPWAARFQQTRPALCFSQCEYGSLQNELALKAKLKRYTKKNHIPSILRGSNASPVFFTLREQWVKTALRYYRGVQSRWTGRELGHQQCLLYTKNSRKQVSWCPSQCPAWGEDIKPIYKLMLQKRCD